MATATAQRTEAEAGEHRFLIPLIDWAGYEALLAILGNRRSIRMSYARGVVELMSPHFPHERFGYLLGRMVHAVTEELDIPMSCSRSTTFRRKDLDRGIEADDSFYLANAHRLPESGDLDLRVVPPPDLAIEIEITNSIVDRLGIYAALGVPEIWRFDGDVLVVLRLQPNGTYAASDTSLAFPFLPLGEVVRFLGEHTPGDETRWAKAFRAWVREVLLPIHRNRIGL